MFKMLVFFFSMILIVKTNSGGYETVFLNLPEAFNEYFINITEEFKFWRSEEAEIIRDFDLPLGEYY